MGYVGQVAPNFGIDNMVLFMRGPDDGQLRVALREDSGIKLAEFRERLRKVLPERVVPWLATRLEKGGLSAMEAQQQAKLSTFGFQPGDIVTNVMSFGSLTPIAVRVVGTDLKMVRQHAEKIAAAMKRIPFLRDVLFEQELDYPERRGHDRPRESGALRCQGRGRGSRARHGDGVDPFRQSELLGRREDGLRLPGPDSGAAARGWRSQKMWRPCRCESVNPLVNLMIRDVATVQEGRAAGRARPRHVAALRDLTANVEGEDMGRASSQVDAGDRRGRDAPRGVRVEPMGQLPPMVAMFKALGIGLAVAVFVIFVLLTAYFQSPRLALISVGAVPGVLAGIATILYFTNTALNIESFMGSIMSLGVSVSNSVMLVTFIDEHWKRGATSTEAAIVGASERLRPILMTACAMTVGMVPMALALERGSQMQAPLGLAVIGGLVMSTFATLLVLPSIFAVVIGGRVARSPSIYPDDPESSHYDPNVFADEGTLRRHIIRIPTHDGHAPDGGDNTADPATLTPRPPNDPPYLEIIDARPACSKC